MTNENLLILVAIVSSPFVGILIKALFDKYKTSAEARNINVTGEVMISEAWMKYAKKIEEDLTNLSKKFDDLNTKFEALKDERNVLASERKLKDERILQLEERVQVLELEVEKYKEIASTIQTSAHTAIDEIANKVTNE